MVWPWFPLVSQHQVQVEVYTRGDDGRWILKDFTALTDRVPLTSVDCTLDLAEVYDKVEFAAHPPSQGKPGAAPG